PRLQNLNFRNHSSSRLGVFALKSLGPESGDEITGSHWLLERTLAGAPVNPKKKVGRQLIYFLSMTPALTVTLSDHH
ncbi:MAG: hypothetical protein P4N59_29825, partial [Negativicutes bacterium]|nr:hypothetical protein [Negativicutes bacterium]